MIINEDILRREAVQLLRQIDQQIEEVKREAASLGIAPHLLRDSRGNWAMIPLLLAKTQAYSMLIQLQTQHKK